MATLVYGSVEIHPSATYPDVSFVCQVLLQKKRKLKCDDGVSEQRNAGERQTG